MKGDLKLKTWHLGKTFVLKRRKPPDIPALAFVDESVGKEISDSDLKKEKDIDIHVMILCTNSQLDW